MRRSSPSRLTNRSLLQRLAPLVAEERANTALLLAQLAEIEDRQLHLRAGYTSMLEFSIEALHLPEDTAHERLEAARAARAHPALIAAVADGRLHVEAVCLLAPHLDAENVEDLIVAATHCTEIEVARMLAARFAPPKPG